MGGVNLYNLRKANRRLQAGEIINNIAWEIEKRNEMLKLKNKRYHVMSKEEFVRRMLEDRNL